MAKRFIIKFLKIAGFLFLFPLVLAFASIIVLPFFQPFFLIKGFHPLSLYIFAGLLLLIGAFLRFYMCRQYSEGNPNKKSLMKAVFYLILAGIMVYTGFDFSSALVLKEKVKRAKLSGIKFKLEEIIPPEIPDEINAASVYKQIFELQEKLRRQNKVFWDDIHWMAESEKIQPQQLKNAEKLLFENHEFIQLFKMIEKAVKMPETRFDLAYKEGPSMLLPHLSKIRNLARLVALKTYIMAKKKDPGWSDSFLTSFSISSSLEDEPVLISQLVRFSLDRIALQNLQKIIFDFNPSISVEQYHKIMHAIENKKNKLLDAWAKEIAFIGGYVYGDVFQARYRKRENFIPFISDYSGPSANIFWFLYPYFFSPILKMDAAYYLDIRTRGLELLRLPMYQVSSRLKELDKELYNQKKYMVASFFAGQTGEIYYPIHKQQSEWACYLHTLRIFCSLQIYKKEKGKYPEKLDEIVPSILKKLPLDPFTGEEYIYKKQKNGFIVYSVGANLKDDAGIRKLQEGKDDISWQCRE